MSYYVGQNVALDLSCTVDGQKMTTAIDADILVLKPNKTSETWPAIIDNISGKIAATGNLDLPGKWKFQPLVEFAVSGVIPGTPIEVTVQKLIA
jgi:hypothetical protein